MPKHWIKPALSILFAGLAALAGTAASAADFPTKPIRILIGYPPGSADVLARMIATGMQERLKQPVVVENRPGANTLIATQGVAQAAADGYTLLYTASPIAQQPVVNKSWNVDPLVDLAPVVTTIRQPVFYVISAKKLPVKNLREFLAFAKANPAKVNIATAGTELGYKLFNQMAGTNIEIVPFKGESPAVTAVIAGDADLTYSSLVGMQQHAAAGSLRVLGVTSLKRSPLMPDVPTIDEAGLPGYQFDIFHAIFAPGATPKDVIAALNNSVVATMREPVLNKRLTDQGYFVIADKPEDLRAHMMAELGQWKKLAAAGVISAQ
jgi:tripartite-type tricarboxylate transporter receptor subunit TctC